MTDVSVSAAPVDASVRQRALDPECSFIVQAPAGSGKTELLTRRILTLLCTVAQPEEILAITFTRKAAGEMRQRVIEQLERVVNGAEPKDDHDANGLSLAAKVIERDERLNWQLLNNPQRLNLRTIDSLATQLAYRLPVTSALGAPVAVLEDAQTLYLDVATGFVAANLEKLKNVLLLLGNRLERVQQLLAQLLANRDQWKRHVYGADCDREALRATLEAMLAELIEWHLKRASQQMPDEIRRQLPRRLQMAVGFLLEDLQGDLTGLGQGKRAWLDRDQMPGTDPSELCAWRTVADVLLTSDNKLRKKVDVRLGFPQAGDAARRGCDKQLLQEHKQGMLDLLASLAGSDGVVELLTELRALPEPQYDDDQWQLLCELLDVLPELLVELQWVFAERRQVDFPEIVERAQRALGSADEPTDLALALDSSIQHVLVDEFQDTSLTQYNLFERLLTGWSAGDGRTFFAVGDPMQSIYRFRDADVSLFARAQAQGVGPVPLESLTLSVNFRAAPALIDWVNTTFSRIFPDTAEPDSGAVTYSASDAFRNLEGRVFLHPLIDGQPDQESRKVAEICADSIAEDPQHTVAILVRSRSHAAGVLAALRDAGLSYQCIDMDPIGERLVVRDLLSLLMALRYPHDRLHWLAVLRAPYIGLTLADIHKLLEGAERYTSIPELLRDAVNLERLSDDGRQRLQRVSDILLAAVARVPRTSLMPWVESVWLRLGGPVACSDAVDLDAAEQALRMLSDLDARGELWRQSSIETALSKLYASAEALPDCRIQLMTLHKSKGLEFDTVILPALERKPRIDGAQLLNWFEGTIDDRPSLLMAPLEAPGRDPKQRDPIVGLVRQARVRLDAQERTRLLYVGCTRARQYLHLLGSRRTDSRGEGLRDPDKSSLLAALAPACNEAFNQIFKSLKQTDAPQTASAASSDVADESGNTPLALWARIAADPIMPDFDRYRPGRSASVNPEKPGNIEFAWAGRDARDIGTVVHHQLQRFASRPVKESDIADPQYRELIARQLRSFGFRAARLEHATDKVITALTNTLSDERGRWILEPHDEARSEWALSVPGLESEKGIKSLVTRVVIDRTFVDEQGNRWVIDFKTGDHAGGQMDEFLDAEQRRYEEQLNRYATIVHRVDQRPVRVGLYFPLLKGWREWIPA